MNDPWTLASGEPKTRLAPHPWDAVAERIYPGAQTAAEAEAALAKKATDELVDDVREHRDEARYLRDQIDDENREGDEARDKLVAAIGEEAARAALGEDNWDGWECV